VQGGFYQRLEMISNKLAVIESRLRQEHTQESLQDDIDKGLLHQGDNTRLLNKRRD
jgi:hypothetical protein